MAGVGSKLYPMGDICISDAESLGSAMTVV
jgi:hypothetical protein